MPLENNNAGLVILGASSFPLSGNYDPEDAFSEAKKRILKYFTNPNGPALVEKTNILDLFDSDKGHTAIEGEIKKFANRLKGVKVNDLFIYYVGHGDYDEGVQDFSLAIKGTEKDNPHYTSIPMKSLARAIKLLAAGIRVVFILDCCFAAKANIAFQDSKGIDGMVVDQLKNDLPDRGVALLCASSKQRRALIIRDRNITMFTEGLDTALQKGSWEVKEKYLTLKELHGLTYSYIKELNPDVGPVRPEPYDPIQPVGDITTSVRYFRNPAYEDRSVDVVKKSWEIQDQIACNNVEAMCKIFIDFTRSFEKRTKFSNEAVKIGSKFNDLAVDRLTILKNGQPKITIEQYREGRDILYARINEIIEVIITENSNSI